jgi:hypothetical protein
MNRELAQRRQMDQERFEPEHSPDLQAREPKRRVWQAAQEPGPESEPGFAAAPRGIRQEKDLLRLPASILPASFAFPDLAISYSF